MACFRLSSGIYEVFSDIVLLLLRPLQGEIHMNLLDQKQKLIRLHHTGTYCCTHHIQRFFDLRPHSWLRALRLMLLMLLSLRIWYTAPANLWTSSPPPKLAKLCRANLALPCSTTGSAPISWNPCMWPWMRGGDLWTRSVSQRDVQLVAPAVCNHEKLWRYMTHIGNYEKL